MKEASIISTGYTVDLFDENSKVATFVKHCEERMATYTQTYEK